MKESKSTCLLHQHTLVHLQYRLLSVDVRQRRAHKTFFVGL